MIFFSLSLSLSISPLVYPPILPSSLGFKKKKTERTKQIMFKTKKNRPDELVHEKEKYKSITDDLDQTFSELSAY